MKKTISVVGSANSGLPESKTPEAASGIETVASGSLSIGVFVLAILATIGALYVGKEVFLPVVLALVLKLMLQPIMNALCERLHVPHTLSALFLIICLFGLVAAVAVTISVPASAWIQKIPEILPDIQQKLEGLRQPIEYLQQAFSAVTNNDQPRRRGAGGGS